MREAFGANAFIGIIRQVASGGAHHQAIAYVYIQETTALTVASANPGEYLGLARDARLGCGIQVGLRCATGKCTSRREHGCSFDEASA
jgi:hypothetical protein